MVHEPHEKRDRLDGEYGHPDTDEADPGAFDDEIRVQRSEEELGVETRQRGAGAVRVRKTVHTDHEEFRVPRRREEVEIERVSAEEVEDSDVPEGTELGENEMVMRVYEEEIVVSKRPVLKEEIRLRKGVVEEEEVIEADLRREEVEVEDQTERGIRRDG